MKLINAIKALPFIQAAKDGKTIQKWSGVKWFDCSEESDISFRHSIAEYRIKPGPNLRAWTIEEAFGKVVKFKSGAISSIVSTASDGTVMCGDVWYSPNELLKKCTQIDGSPCGVEE